MDRSAGTEAHLHLAEIEIVSGLSAGATVVAHPGALPEGTVVEAVPLPK